MSLTEDEYLRYAAKLYNIEQGDVNEEQIKVARSIGKGFTMKMAFAATDTYLGDEHDVVQKYKHRELSHFKYYRTALDEGGTTFLYVAVKFTDGEVIHFTTTGAFANGYLEKRKSTPSVCYIRDTVRSIKKSCETLGYLI